MFKQFFISLLGCCVIIFALGYKTRAQDKDWPREIKSASGAVITLYQPQPEKLDGNKLTGRAALSVKETKNADPVFGALWFIAILSADRDTRTSTLESVTITKIKFSSDQEEAKLEKLDKIIEDEVPKWEMQISMDQLLTSIQQEQQLNDPDLKNDPPKIIYTTKPSTLISIDGEPKIMEDKQLKIERVVNSPFLIVKNPSDHKFYLYGGGFWYVSDQATAGYTYTKKLPAAIKSIDDQVQKSAKEAAGKDSVAKPTTPTEIIVSTEPSELIQTEGEATYKNIEGTYLLYADNTLDEIFKDINTQKTYTLIAGRWYSAPKLEGPWTYVPGDKLPTDFAKIPQGSEKDGVLASVPGTEEANEAVMDAQIPQTAKIDRKTAKCTVTYDGAPKFTNIENTSLQLAENSNITVLKSSDGRYYAVDNGVWYVSSKADGPWAVADERPKDVEKIPPSNSAYNTKYVYVYESTPEYVYTGYTPGYMGCYIYGPTVVWGTGYYYRPWYGSVYYPRPITWGFGMSYNPWMGWSMSFGMSFNMGWFSFGFGTMGYGCWFGPRAYWPPYGGWGYHGGYYGPRGGAMGYRPNVNINRPVNINNINNHFDGSHRNNIYNKVNGAHTNNLNRRPGNSGLVQRPNGGTTRPAGNNTTRPAGNNSTRPAGNNTRPGNANRPDTRPAANTRPANPGRDVIADRQGNVMQRDNSGQWQQQRNNQWQQADRNQAGNADRMQRSMDRGNMRTQNYRQSMPASRPSNMQMSRPAGGGRGGGFRR